MRNKFPGTCYRCGETVSAEAGHFERISNSQRRKWNAPRLHGWLTQHIRCAIRFRGTNTHHVYAPAGRTALEET